MKDTPPPVRRAQPTAAGLRWKDVPLKQYKEDGSLFKAVTRQVLFDGVGDLPSQLRYFEMAPGGHSTLERHQHVHAVLILHGAGHVLVGEEVHAVGRHDLVYVPPMTWHQFRAGASQPLGFLCLVACERDRPVRPGEAELAELLEIPDVAAFVRV